MNALAAFKRAHPQVTDDQIARGIGKGRTYVNKLVNDNASPSLKVAIMLERLSGGAVPANQWQPPGLPEKIDPIVPSAKKGRTNAVGETTPVRRRDNSAARGA